MLVEDTRGSNFKMAETHQGLQEFILSSDQTTMENMVILLKPKWNPVTIAPHTQV